MYRTAYLPEHSGRNGWFETSRYKGHRFNSASELQSSYDYVVVGGGFAGVNAAFRLHENEPQATIALIDALPIGYFSSGRNAGFIIDVPHSIVGDPKFSLDDQKWRFRLNRLVIERMAKIKNDFHLECDWFKDGMHQAAKLKNNLSYLEELARFLDLMQAEYSWYDATETAARLGTDFYTKSLYTPGTILINPAETVRGLASVLPSQVQVFENCPVLEVTPGPIPEVMTFAGQKITCRQVILTVSAFAQHFGIPKARRIAGIHSFAAFTRELTAEELNTLHGARPWGVTAAHPAGATLRFTRTGRLYVRTDITFATHLNIDVSRLYKSVYKLRRAFVRRFPQLAEVPFEYIYGGYIPITGNTQPLFENPAQNVFVGAVGDGTGVTRAATVGTFLADWVTGRDSEELRYVKKTFKPSWLPPEPFRTVGATARLLYEDLHARIEI